jgi:hypothetical protein
MLKPPQHSLSSTNQTKTTTKTTKAVQPLSLLGSIDVTDVSDYLDGLRRLIVKYNGYQHTAQHSEHCKPLQQGGGGGEGVRTAIPTSNLRESQNKKHIEHSKHEVSSECAKKALLKACETVYALSSSRFSSPRDRVRMCYAENGVILALKDVIRDCSSTDTNTNNAITISTIDTKILKVVLHTILAFANESENLPYLHLPEVGLVRELEKLENVASFSSEARHALKRIHKCGGYTFSSGTVASLGTTLSDVVGF